MTRAARAQRSGDLDSSALVCLFLFSSVLGTACSASQDLQKQQQLLAAVFRNSSNISNSLQQLVADVANVAVATAVAA